MMMDLPPLTLTQESILRLLAQPRCLAVYTMGCGSGWWTLSCNQRRVRGPLIKTLLAAGLIKIQEGGVVAEISQAGREMLEQTPRGRWGRREWGQHV